MATADARPDRTPLSPFWSFSLRLYGRPEVPPACLVLQDSSGVPVDVNIVLFCLFCAREGRDLTSRDARRMMDLTESWRHDIVVPLRSVRRALKEPPQSFAGPFAEALRQRVKAVELESERLQQESLFAHLPVTDFGISEDYVASAGRNLMAYETALCTRFNRDAVNTLLEAFNALKD